MYNAFNKYYVSQVDEADCGVAALSMILRKFGSKVSLATLRKATKTTTEGTTALGIVEAAKKYKLNVAAYQADINLFSSNEASYPFIAHLIKKDTGLLHYCVVVKNAKNHLIIADPNPNIKIQKVSKEAFFQEWTGIAIFANPANDYEIIQEQSPTLKRLIIPVIEQKKLLIGIVTSAFLVTFINIISSYFFQGLIDRLIPYKLLTPLNIICIGLLIAYVANSLFNFTRDYLLATLGQRLSKTILLDYIKHVLKLPMEFFSTRKTGDIVSRFTDANKVIDALVNSIISIFLDTTMLCIIGITLAIQNLKLFILTLITIPVYLVIIGSFTHSFKVLNQKEMESNATVSASIIEDIRGIETIKSLNSEENRLTKIENEFNDFLHKSLTHTKLNSIQQSLKSFTQLAFSLIILWFGAIQVINNQFTIGQLMTYNALLVYFITPLQNIINLQPKIQSAQVANNRLNEVYMVQDEFIKKKLSHKITNGDIEIKNVNYSYQYNHPILKDINWKITPGTKMTVVGMSGSGKSTLMKLLVNYFNPTSGQILVNGLNILDIDKTTVRSFINYIPQNPYIFSGTIKENLLLGSRTDITDEDITKACKVAMIHDDIMHLSLGYDSKLDENATTLSGGQKQRLTVARALLSPAKVIILDESTSGLDIITEEKLVKNLMNLTSKTIIFIAHRLSIAKITNNITVINNGTIVEQGTHNQLLKEHGLYFNLLQKY
ncbi:peptide cleavage/export ABC transporter [Limosilactobacillus reuteri]|uniref:ABC-type bacteriocin transporter n=3 Tax=Limosilactobacillus reuteri TaxID=1598 RepID=B3XMM2_LIMR1|nr:peptide cleavage/export ABC transporter [Limosilactobacillus reuteri]EDX43290.1 ABC-type bacteriocin transporter [Limosilactobacillus reuteri subsp. rodentium]MCC4476051.1 peptide cleavage/export ABC transporter [Limosilactobacillus reuteri]